MTKLTVVGTNKQALSDDEHWNIGIIKKLVDTIKYLKKVKNANGLSVVVTHTDGSVSVMYTASNEYQLIGGLEYVKSEIIQGTGQMENV